MKVLMVEPHKNAYEADIGNDLKSMQKAVGGLVKIKKDQCLTLAFSNSLFRFLPH